MAFTDFGRKSADGFILIAVLWILGGLATLAAIYALYVINAATSLAVNNDRIQAEASISSALELTAYYLTAGEANERPRRGSFGFHITGSDVAVRFKPEAARIDLNEAPKPLLVGLFIVLGAQPELADKYADRIVGWRTNATTPNQDQDPEITAYRNAGLWYNPRQGPFTNVRELWLVLGLPPAIVERAMPFITIFSGLPSIDAVDAAPEIIAALPGMTPDRLYEILNQRNTQPQNEQQIMRLLGPAQGNTTMESSKATRVTVVVNLAKGRRISAEAVILPIEDAPDPYRVLSWSDDFEG